MCIQSLNLFITQGKSFNTTIQMSKNTTIALVAKSHQQMKLSCLKEKEELEEINQSSIIIHIL